MMPIIVAFLIIVTQQESWSLSSHHVDYGLVSADNLDDLFEQTSAELESEYRSQRWRRETTSSGGKVGQLRFSITHYFINYFISIIFNPGGIRPVNSKSTPDSARIHDSFMVALKVSKKLTNNTKLLKSPPKFCPFSFDITCDSLAKYRQIDGSCNNLGSALIGRSSTPFKRFIKPAYDDGMNEPRKNSVDGGPLPNARLVSLIVHSPQDLPARISNMGVMFGQFIDHDFAQSAATGSGSTPLKCSCGSFNSDCVNINTPEEDEFDSDQQCMVFYFILV